MYEKGPDPFRIQAFKQHFDQYKIIPALYRRQIIRIPDPVACAYRAASQAATGIHVISISQFRQIRLPHTDKIPVSSRSIIGIRNLQATLACMAYAQL
ncbi:hypothetical protein CLOHYLEM_07286 [[Clostridium] hylemonae DSM 15053]|uniref:Uncharacterized protein n=1 Tax=[Clostridium] hylemonae DSM 15053 TaxID=553973 RepID=C0C5B1_9FIRM|nr:hypothetical protein CLOHYLEM_07286 [[Clostridium] hylemonae DSM 15053]